MPSQPVKLFRLASGIGLGILIVFCAFVVGSPWEQRKRALDQRIRSDIALIAGKLEDFRNNGTDLPTSLEDLECALHERPYDPEGDDQKGCATKAISYERLAHDTARLCATFLLQGPDNRKEALAAPRHSFRHEFDNKALAPLIGHPAGRFCFDLKIEVKAKPDNKR